MNNSFLAVESKQNSASSESLNQGTESNSRRSILVEAIILSHLSPDKHYALLKYLLSPFLSCLSIQP